MISYELTIDTEIYANYCAHAKGTDGPADEFQ